MPTPPSALSLSNNHTFYFYYFWCQQICWGFFFTLASCTSDQCTIPNVPNNIASDFFIKCRCNVFFGDGWLQNIHSLEGTNAPVAPLKKESLPVFHTSLVQHCVLEGGIVLMMKVEVLPALPPGWTLLSSHRYSRGFENRKPCRTQHETQMYVHVRLLRMRDGTEHNHAGLIQTTWLENGVIELHMKAYESTSSVLRVLSHRHHSYTLMHKLIHHSGGRCIHTHTHTLQL